MKTIANKLIINGFDVSEFCKDDIRTGLDKPYTNNGFIYATNGHLLIRIDSSLAPEYSNPVVTGCPNYESVLKHGVRINFIEFNIPEALKGIEPRKADKYSQIKCDICDGEGECHACHRECDECNGTGMMDTGDPIGEEILYTPVPFLNVHVDYRYLSLIQKAIEAMSGNWKCSTGDELDCVYFQNEMVTIVAMPMRV